MRMSGAALGSSITARDGRRGALSAARFIAVVLVSALLPLQTAVGGTPNAKPAGGSRGGSDNGLKYQTDMQSIHRGPNGQNNDNAALDNLTKLNRESRGKVDEALAQQRPYNGETPRRGTPEFNAMVARAKQAIPKIKQLVTGMYRFKKRDNLTGLDRDWTDPNNPSNADENFVNETMSAFNARLNEIAETAPWLLLALMELAEKKGGGIKIQLNNGKGHDAEYSEPRNGKPGVIVGDPTEQWIIPHELGHLWDDLHGNGTIDRSHVLGTTLSELAAIYHEMVVTGDTNYWDVLRSRYGNEGGIYKGMAALKGVMSRRAAKNKVSFEEYQEELVRRLNGSYWEDPTLMSELAAISEELEKEVGTMAANHIVSENLHHHIMIAGKEGYMAGDYVTPVEALFDKMGLSGLPLDLKLMVLRQLITDFGTMEAVEEAFNSKKNSPNKKKLNDIVDGAKAINDVPR